jgi:hypothetical protein
LNSKEENILINRKNNNKNIENNNENIKNEIIIKKDPLNWFGIIQPKSLKEAQNYFKNSIDIILKISNIKIKILNLLNKEEEKE